ncbi:MAG: alpha/beta hydrolase [Eubacterium sp.]|nr:alpha/beta hydrolase [Eubacterium sp.]
MKKEMENNEIFLGENEKIAAYSYVVENPKETIILIHGIGEHAGRYRRVVRQFNKEGFSVFAMDLKGHGKSKGVRGHCAPRKEILQDIDCLFEYVKKMYPQTNPVIYGHSMGGNIVTDYRYRGKYSDQFKGYVISAPWIKLTRKIPLYQNIGLRIISKIKPDFQINSAVDGDGSDNKGQNSANKKDPLLHGFASAQLAVEGHKVGKALYKGTYPVIGNGRTVPMLLMHGDADRICHIDGSRALAKHEGEICTYKEWEGCPHALHRTGDGGRGREVIAYVISWIEKL